MECPYPDPQPQPDMPTRGGLLLLATGLVVGLAGRLFGLLEFVVVGVIACLAVLLAVALRRARESQLSVSRRLSSSRVEAGQPIQVDLEIINSGSSKSPLLRLHDNVGDTRGIRLSLAPIERNGTTVAAYRLPTTRRGIIRLGPVLIDDTDAAGLARRGHTFNSTARLLVHPAIEPVPEVRILSGHDPMMGDQQRQTLGISDEEFDGLREYQPGDDLRKVHWPSSARHDELLVRQFQPPRHGRVVLVIDTRPPGDDTTILDITTSIAASIAASVLAAGDSVRVETTDGRSTPVLTGRSRLVEALEFLALLENGDAKIHSSVPSSGGRVVVISAADDLWLDPEARSGLARRLSSSMVITVDPSSWSPRTLPGGGGHGWAHLTGPGQIGGAWQRFWSRKPVMT